MGAGAIILPGVIIEDYAVVGAGAVVTKNVGTGSIVAGIPAVKISQRDESTYRRRMKIYKSNQAKIIKLSYLNKYCSEN